MSDLERKEVSAEYKAADDTGSISGHGAVFGNEDFGGDIIVKGAFDDTLTDIQSKNAKGQKLPILWQHDYYEPIGPWNELSVGEKGLMADGELLIDTDPLAKRAHGLAKSGALSGLSIGFRIPKGGQEYDGDIRYLKRIDLHEISIVTFPMNDEARIDAVKAHDLTARQMERILTRDARLSASVAKSLMSGGFTQVQSMRDAGEDIDELARLLKRRTELLTA